MIEPPSRLGEVMVSSDEEVVAVGIASVTEATGVTTGSFDEEVAVTTGRTAVSMGVAELAASSDTPRNAFGAGAPGKVGPAVEYQKHFNKEVKS